MDNNGLRANIGGEKRSLRSSAFILVVVCIDRDNDLYMVVCFDRIFLFFSAATP